jgi:hypothetical protein
MIYFSRFFLGCVVIAVLSLSGCSTGTAFDSYPGASTVIGSNRAAEAPPERDRGVAAATGEHNWWNN